MPDTAETDRHAMLWRDRDSGYVITSTALAAGPGQAAQRDSSAVILAAAAPEQLSKLIHADCCIRSVPREVAP